MKPSTFIFTTRPSISSFRPPVCIDGRMLDCQGAGTGVGRYARTLLATLQAAGVSPRILDGGGRSAHRTRLGKLAAAFRPWARTTSIDGDTVFARDIFREAQVFFDIHRRPMPLIFPGPPGIMHWTYPLPLHVRGWRNLYTVHDVLPLDPAIPSPVNGPRLRRILEALRAEKGRFLTVSEAARDEIVRRMVWPDDAVAACHQAVDVADAGRSGSLPANLRDDGYLVYVGAIEDRKNLHRLLDAYHESGVRVPLVLSGPDGLGVADIDRHVAGTPGAIRLGLQPREAVLRLIAGARALTFVSLAEGFGLPVAEAMALGTPVLAADVPALAEVTQGAALLVDPLDVSAIGRALRRIESDATLRMRLAAAGLERARHFAVEPYARRLLALYEAI